MKKVINTLILVCIAMSMIAQINLEIDGKAKVSVVETDNTADKVVVRQSDGTLAVRDVSTISEVYTAGAGIDIANNEISATGSPWYLGKDTLGGIVYYIYKGSDGQDHGLIVDTTESTAQWQNPESLVSADRSWDGVYNMGQMSNSPAKTYVQSRGPGWYLPSIDELSLLWHNRFHVNKALSDGAHTLLSTTQYYWSSTEYAATYAWTFSFGNGYNTSYPKTNTRSVRAIRVF